MHVLYKLQFYFLQSDREKGVFAKGKISYDESNMRFRIIDELGNKTEQEYFDTLVLHNVVSYYRSQHGTSPGKVQ